MLFNYNVETDIEKAREFFFANKYDNVSAKLEEKFIYKYIYKNTKRILFSAGLLPKLEEGLKVLEIGAVPYCFSTILMESFACDVTTLDLPMTLFPGEPYEIKKEEVEIPNSMTNKNYKVTSYTCNAEKDTYPFQDETFDVVICTEVLEHLLYSPTHVFTECHRVLKNGGIMLASTVNALHFKRMEGIILNKNIDDVYTLFGPYGRHNRNYTRKELIHLAESNNFQVRDVTTATLRGQRSEYDEIVNVEEKQVPKKKEHKIIRRLKKLPEKIFHALIRAIVYLPLPGMKDKRHVNIFMLLEKGKQG